MYEPIKKLGQNFLMDQSLVRVMVGALNIGGGEDIIEIGPGLGALTENIVQSIGDKPSNFFAVEIDERFSKKLEDMYSENLNVKVVNDDILQFLPKFDSQKTVKIIGSLPYYITSPIIHSIIKMKKKADLCVLLVQREVAEKIKSKAPDASYLSSFVQTFYDVEYLGKVEAKKFKPEPEVDGGIIVLKKIHSGLDASETEKYEGFLHKAYSHPRKMLNKMFTAEELQKGNINPSLRAQNLNSEDWVNFFRILHP